MPFPATLTNEKDLGLKDTWDQACITFNVSNGGPSAFEAGDFTDAGNFDGNKHATTRQPNADNAIDVHFVGGSKIDNAGAGVTGITSVPATDQGDWNAQVYVSDALFDAQGFRGWNVLSHELGHALDLSRAHNDVVAADCFGSINNHVNAFPTDLDVQIGMDWKVIEKMINLVDAKSPLK